MSLIDAAQLRAARSMLRWEQEQAATAAGVSVATISRLEGLNGEMDARLGTLRRIQRAFEEAGIEFTNGDKPGVRLDPTKAQTANAAA
jgi:predicted transcriptional regulator